MLWHGPAWCSLYCRVFACFLLRWSGFRRLAREHWRTGAAELLRARSRRAFAATARRYVPALQPGDMRRAPAGVRAQCVTEVEQHLVFRAELGGQPGQLVGILSVFATGMVLMSRRAVLVGLLRGMALAFVFAIVEDLGNRDGQSGDHAERVRRGLRKHVRGTK